MITKVVEKLLYFAIPFCFIGWICNNKDNMLPRDQVFIIPSDFEGVLIRVFSQKDGLEPQYEGNNLVYRFPQNGVLILKSERPATRGTITFYFEDSLGARELVTYVYPTDNLLSLNQNKKYAFGALNRLGLDGDDEVRYSTVIIGKLSASDSLSEISNSINISKIKKRQAQ
jgi:hypothetical protein